MNDHGQRNDHRQRAWVFPAAAALGVVGLVAGGVAALYVAALFGLSAAVASQIISAVQVGGWVLAVVLAALSGGIAGAVVATARWAIARWGATYAAV